MLVKDTGTAHGRDGSAPASRQHQSQTPRNMVTKVTLNAQETLPLQPTGGSQGHAKGHLLRLGGELQLSAIMVRDLGF